VNAAVEQNLGLLSRKLATQIADLEINRQKASYAPTVNLTASSTRVDTGGSLYGSGQAYNNNEVGIRLSMPLFEGGSTASLVREATARLGKAQSEYDQELRRSERQARASFSSVLASIESQDALRHAVVAQQSALEAREEGLRSGLYTPVAVIDAYRLYYAAKRDYLQARYDYLVNRLKLKQAVGILSRNDLEDLNALLEQ
jgi:outer membrane protein